MNASECLNNILLITDDARLAGLINEHVSSARYTLTLCTGGMKIPQTIMRVFRIHNFDAVLLDMSVLLAIGPEIIRLIRFRDEKLDIILLNTVALPDRMKSIRRDETQMVIASGVPDRLLMTLDRMMIRKRLSDVTDRHGGFPAPLVDGATGLFARGYFCERVVQEIRSMQRSGGSFTVLFCAISGLKQIYNDYGINTGDAVLKQVSMDMRAACRRCDTMARTRMDEISILLPTASVEGSRMVAQRLINAVRGISHGLKRDGTTAIAIGMSTYPVHAKLSRDLLHIADKALCRSRATHQGMYTMYGIL